MVATQEPLDNACLAHSGGWPPEGSMQLTRPRSWTTYEYHLAIALRRSAVTVRAVQHPDQRPVPDLFPMDGIGSNRC